MFLGSWAWVTLTLSSEAFAEEPLAADAGVPTPAEILPPRALGELGAAYPAEGMGEHDCEVELVVGSDGVPRDVSVSACGSPFAEAASAAEVTSLRDAAQRSGHEVQF